MQVAVAALTRMLFINVKRIANLHLRIEIFTALLSVSTLILGEKKRFRHKNNPYYDEVMQRLLC